MTPLVTVLMPVYNNEKFLELSLKSITNQTFFDFEFLIINDASIDKSEEIILSFLDRRIRYVKNDRNNGVANTLNRGMHLANGEYIVRMDADDYALSIRIEKQLLFMSNNTDVGLVGSFFSGFGEHFKRYEYCQDHDEIKIEMICKNVIGHPTVMIRKNLFQKFNLFYNEKYLYCEDYELWSRAIRYFRFANIAEYLLAHRKHTNQISTMFRDLQQQKALMIKLNQIMYIHTDANPHEYEIYKAVLQGSSNKFSKLALNKLSDKLLSANLEKKIYNHQKLEKFIYNLFNQWKHE